MLKATPKEVSADREGSLKALMKKLDTNVYLKGAPGILALKSQPSRFYVNLSINPIFSKAGSGDVLSGILGGFLAQRPMDFRQCVFSALVFQREVGEVLRRKRASLSADQLDVFSEAFERLQK